MTSTTITTQDGTTYDMVSTHVDASGVYSVYLSRNERELVTHIAGHDGETLECTVQCVTRASELDSLHSEDYCVTDWFSQCEPSDLPTPPDCDYVVWAEGKAYLVH